MVNRRGPLECRTRASAARAPCRADEKHARFADERSDFSCLPQAVRGFEGKLEKTCREISVDSRLRRNGATSTSS